VGEADPRAALAAAHDAALAHAERGDYRAAHEAFEALWRAHSDPAGAAFRALAQWMAAYHQAELGRGRAAARTWDKARAKLDALGQLSPALARDVTEWLERHHMEPEGPRYVAPVMYDPMCAAPLPARLRSCVSRSPGGP
jgi:Domain of unknown function (DUF309)